ncbi:MAG: hypothetical protein RAP70_08305 [Candidatus Celaenobacter antarcticus]|nr:hypothetical protein [Candidatus Celaenobacter antarcticus]
MNGLKSQNKSNLGNKLYRIRFILLWLFFIVVGIILIIGFEDLFTNLKLHRKEFGIAILTAGSIAMAIDFFTRKQFQYLLNRELSNSIESSSLTSKLDVLMSFVQLSENMKKLGVNNIFPNREFNILDLLRNAEPKTEICLCGICLSDFVDNAAQEVIKLKLSQECKIKILLLDPNSESLRERAYDEEREEIDLRTVVSNINELHKNFANSNKSSPNPSIEIRYYYSYPKCFLIITDKSVIVGNYLLGGLGKKQPHIALDRNIFGISDTFIKHFETLWLNSKPIT